MTLLEKTVFPQSFICTFNRIFGFTLCTVATGVGYTAEETILFLPYEKVYTFIIIIDLLINILFCFRDDYT